MGDLREAGVGLRRRQRPRRAAGVNGDGIALGGHDKPEAIAAEAVHMRVNHGDGRSGGDHRFYGASAFAQNRQRALAGQMMGRNRHPAGGNMTLHGVSSIKRNVRRGLQKLFHV